MKKQTGIWLDLRNAWIINLPATEDGAVEMQHLLSEIDESGPTGGTRSKAPWGHQGGDNQSSKEEHRHHEEDDYFHSILELIPPATDDVVIFGPSKAKYGLQNLLEKQHKAPKIRGIESAGQMTINQMKEWVLDFFCRSAVRK
ncbi:hypothetical protein [Haliscomenobacter sp.]|uniref:hypothetical protein n=1 Tax=Haliscomenobacter sp. TaxID=2717303 RepID=UPI003BABBD42